jgi:plastocyanin
MRRQVPLAVALALLAAPTAHAATRTITIGSAFTPSVVVVPPGTTLIWRNSDGQAHSFSGDVNSATIAPGASTAPRVLNREGQYHYALTGNGAVKGTVVVARTTPRPRHALGAASRTYRGSLTLTVNEKYSFYDNQWRSTSGACNAEVGDGSRTVQMRVSLPKVKYFRGHGAESLAERGASARFIRYAEQVAGKTSTSASPEVKCQDGTTTDQAADQSVNCFRDHAGRTARGTFAWTPSGTGGRFEFVSHRSSIARCGTGFSGILESIGVPSRSLPLNLIDRGFSYSSISTTPSTALEVRGIRAGHPIRVVRQFNLQFTTGCCDGYQPQGEADTRIGTLHTVTARMVLSLRPR